MIARREERKKNDASVARCSRSRRKILAGPARKVSQESELRFVPRVNKNLLLARLSTALPPSFPRRQRGQSHFFVTITGRMSAASCTVFSAATAARRHCSDRQYSSRTAHNISHSLGPPTSLCLSGLVRFLASPAERSRNRNRANAQVRSVLRKELSPETVSLLFNGRL